MARRRTRLLFVGTLLSAAALATGVSPAASNPAPSTDRGTSVVISLGRLPLAFEPNRGQAPPEMRYIARTARYRLGLTPTEIRFTAAEGLGREGPMVRLRLIGSAAAAQLTAEDALPGKVHYLDDPDPSKWQRNVPTYRRVVYHGVYPGIDLVFHGTQREAEFDFVVAPGADPRAIRLELIGGDRLDADGGDLIAGLGATTLRVHKPVVYQEIAGRRVPVDGQFRTRGRAIAFDLGNYDRRHALVIDPVVTWAAYPGQMPPDYLNWEFAERVAVDGAGYAYVLTDAGYAVVKLTPDGSAIVYTTWVSRNGASFNALAVDRAGHPYVVGSYRSWDGSPPHFPVTANALQPNYGGDCGEGNGDGIVMKLDVDGSTPLYASYLGGACDDSAEAVAVDDAENIYVGGWTVSGIPTTRPSFEPAGATGTRAFVVKIAADFSRYVYAVMLGVADGTTLSLWDIAADMAGNAYLIGRAGPGFPTATGALQPSIAPGATAPWIAKISPDGSRMIYGSYLGNDSTYIWRVASDSAGNAIAAGTSGPGLPTANALQPAVKGAGDAFVTKLDPTGALVFSTYLGGSSDYDSATGVGTDAMGNIYVGGRTSSTDFPLFRPMGTTPTNTFAASLTPDGQLVYSTYTSLLFIDDLAASPSGTVYLAGSSTLRDLYQRHPAEVVRLDPTLGAGFMSPDDAATVSGTVTIGMRSFEARSTPITFTLAVDGSQVFTTSVAAASAAYAWNTATVTNGNHTLALTVRDGAGYTATATRTVATVNGSIRVFITAPADGATVSGTSWLTIWIENAAAGSKTFSLDIAGTPGGSTTSTSNGPVSMAWDSRTVANGSQTATVTATDSAGNTGNGSITLNVQNTGGGDQPPLVASFTSPPAGSTVTGNVTVGMSETGASGTPIFFTLSVDSTQVFTTSGAATSASYSWNSASVANGSHTLNLTVRDGAGRTGTAARTVTVTNTQPPPPPPATIKVFITQPGADGATVSGTTWFTVWIENAAAGSKTYTLSVGGATMATTTTTSNGPVSIPWSTTGTPNGSRTATVTVQDPAGATGSAPRIVNVAN
jgi:hypothetical protein